MDVQDTKMRILAAYELLTEEKTTRKKFESIRTLIKGIHPKTDAILDRVSKNMTDFGKFQEGEIIELSVEKLSENTDQEKRRKKALLLFIRSWKDLQNEVNRMRTELTTQQKENVSKGEQSRSVGRIVTAAKGPFGIITVAAIVIIGVSILFTAGSKQQAAPVNKTVESEGQIIQVIEFNGKQIPLSELAVRSGHDCDSPHYHAANNTTVKATDGTVIPDPGACAFGKAKDVRIEEITI